MDGADRHDLARGLIRRLAARLAGERARRDRAPSDAAGGAGRAVGVDSEAERLPRAAVVHALAQLLANLEESEALRADVDRLARARVAPLVLLVRADREAAEAADLDPLALAERVDHRVEHLADQKLGAAMGQLGPLGDQVDEVGLGHAPR